MTAVAVIVSCWEWACFRLAQMGVFTVGLTLVNAVVVSTPSPSLSIQLSQQLGPGQTFELNTTVKSSAQHKNLSPLFTECTHWRSPPSPLCFHRCGTAPRGPPRTPWAEIPLPPSRGAVGGGSAMSQIEIKARIQSMESPQSHTTFTETLRWLSDCFVQTPGLRFCCGSERNLQWIKLKVKKGKYLNEIRTSWSARFPPRGTFLFSISC